MVGDDAEGDVDFFLFGFTCGARSRQGARVLFAAEFFDLVEEGAKDVGVVVRDFVGVLEGGEVLRAVDDGDDALEAHAGIDVLGGEGDEAAVGVGVVLDEDVVPDFDTAGVGAVD